MHDKERSGDVTGRGTVKDGGVSDGLKVLCWQSLQNCWNKNTRKDDLERQKTMAKEWKASSYL